MSGERSDVTEKVEKSERGEKVPVTSPRT